MTDDTLKQLLKDVQYLKDRQAILDVIMRQARGHDRHDAELMNSCFWPDGVDEVAPRYDFKAGYARAAACPQLPLAT